MKRSEAGFGLELEKVWSKTLYKFLQYFGASSLSNAKERLRYKDALITFLNFR